MFLQNKALYSHEATEESGDKTKKAKGKHAHKSARLADSTFVPKRSENAKKLCDKEAQKRQKEEEIRKQREVCILFLCSVRFRPIYSWSFSLSQDRLKMGGRTLSTQLSEDGNPAPKRRKLQTVSDVLQTADEENVPCDGETDLLKGRDTASIRFRCALPFCFLHLPPVYRTIFTQ